MSIQDLIGLLLGLISFIMGIISLLIVWYLERKIPIKNRKFSKERFCSLLDKSASIFLEYNKNFNLENEAENLIMGNSFENVYYFFEKNNNSLVDIIVSYRKQIKLTKNAELLFSSYSEQVDVLKRLRQTKNIIEKERDIFLKPFLEKYSKHISEQTYYDVSDLEENHVFDFLKEDENIELLEKEDLDKLKSLIFSNKRYLNALSNSAIKLKRLSRILEVKYIEDCFDEFVLLINNLKTYFNYVEAYEYDEINYQFISDS